MMDTQVRFGSSSVTADAAGRQNRTIGSGLSGLVLKIRAMEWPKPEVIDRIHSAEGATDKELVVITATKSDRILESAKVKAYGTLFGGYGLN